MGAKNINSSIRFSVYRRDNYTCQYCGTRMKSDETWDLTLDHVVTQSHGGLHHADNLRTSCRTCNSRKGTRSVEDFRFLMRMHVAGIGGVISISQTQELIRRGFDLKLPGDYLFYFEYKDN